MIEIPTPEEVGVNISVGAKQLDEDAAKIAEVLTQYLVDRIPFRSEEDFFVHSDSIGDNFPYHIKYEDVGVMDLPVFGAKALSKAWKLTQTAFDLKGWNLRGRVVTPRCYGCMSHVVVTVFEAK